MKVILLGSLGVFGDVFVFDWIGIVICISLYLGYFVVSEVFHCISL